MRHLSVSSAMSRRSAFTATLTSTLLACGASESPSAAQPRPVEQAVHGWSSRALSTLATRTPATPQTQVLVGGRPVLSALGLPAAGTPSLSGDGTWAVWSGARGVTVFNIQTGTTRSVALPWLGGRMPTAFFGADFGELAIAMTEETPNGDRRGVILIYDTASLRLTHALSTSTPYHGCSELLGTRQGLLCIVDRESAGEPVEDPSYALAIEASTHALRGIPLESGIYTPVVSDDGTHLYYASASGIVDVTLATGRAHSFAGPETQVTALAVSPNASHLAIGDAHGALALHELPSGAQVRSAEDAEFERLAIAVSSDLTLFDHRNYRLTAHLRDGTTRVAATMSVDSFVNIRITPSSIIAASYVGLDVYDRSTLALDVARTMRFRASRAFWRGSEIHLLSPSSSANGTLVPMVFRWDVATGTLVGAEQTRAAMMTATGGSPTRQEHGGLADDNAPWVVSPDQRAAIAIDENGAELVALAEGRLTASLSYHGHVYDAAFRGDGAELALSVECNDFEDCRTRVLRFSLPNATLTSTLPSQESELLVAYAPSNDALALVSVSGIVIQPLSEGWTAH
jgi:hypothetical protein